VTDIPDYDMSIHTNPDAAVWAKFFKEKFPDSDEDLMLGWFANAMMAMHDHINNKVQAQLAAANARADGSRDAALADLWGKHVRYMTSKGRNPGDYTSQFSLAHDAILALRDKPAPAVTVDIDALAYRFWSIHPKDIPDPVGMPEGYKGGARAWMYATEIREVIRAIAGGGDE